eukprot:g7013.t1
MSDCEKLIDEKKVSLEKWKDALHKMKESGVILGKNKANEAEVWDVQEKFERKRSSALTKEKKCNEIERLVEELNYGIEGMVYRLGLQNDKKKRRGEQSYPASDPYSPTKSEEDITRQKDEEALQAVIASLDETKAAVAKLQQREQKRKRKYKQTVNMLKQWFGLVKERKTLVNYYIQTKNTRLLEKYAPFIRKLSYTQNGRKVLKAREQVLNTIRRYGKPVAAHSNSAISMLHRTVGKRSRESEKKSPSIKGILKQRRMSNIFTPKKKLKQKKKMTKEEKQYVTKKLDPNNDILEAFIEKKVEEMYESPENRRVKTLVDEDGADPNIIKAYELLPLKDDELQEFYNEQKTNIKQDTKAHLHLKLWEAEAQGDIETIQKAEMAIAKHNFSKKRKPRQKKKSIASSLHRPKRTTMAGDKMFINSRQIKKT